MNCSEFLDGFSDYLDGVGDPQFRGQLENHLASCPSCRSYEHAYRQGRKLLASYADLEVSEDFRPRLQHRIYHLDDAVALARSGSGSAASGAAILGMAIILALVAWSPLMRPDEPLIELSPIVVTRHQPRPIGLRPAPVSVATLAGMRAPLVDLGSLDLWESSHLLLYEYSALSARYRQAPVRTAGLP